MAQGPFFQVPASGPTARQKWPLKACLEHLFTQMDPRLLLLAFGRLPAGSPGVASEGLFGTLFVARALFPVSGKLSGGSPEMISEGMFGGLFRPYGCKGPFSRFRPTGPAGASRRGALLGLWHLLGPRTCSRSLACAPGPRVSPCIYMHGVMLSVVELSRAW